MPATLSYPGVYIEEKSSGVHTIMGVATSITAFVGRASRGFANTPVRVQSFADFERKFGGFAADCSLSYAVSHFFLNGGTDALIVRVVHSNDPTPANNASKSEIAIPGGLSVQAASEGSWGDKLRARVDLATSDTSNTKLFNLFVKDAGTGVLETFRNVSVDPTDKRFVGHILAEQSTLVRLLGNPP